MAGAYVVNVTVQDNVNNVAGTTETNVSQMPGNQTDGTIAVDPTSTSRLFSASAEEGTGLFVASSGDGGVTWTGQAIAAGGDSLPVAGGQPRAAFDQFGNLYLAYVDQSGQHIVVAISTDGGQSFTTLEQFYSPSGVSRPLIATGPGTNGTASVWLTFLDGTQQIDATGLAADSLGVAGVFNPVQIAASAAAGATLNLGGLAVGPLGQVLVSYQTQTDAAGPSAIYAVLDANGLSPGGFGSPVLVSTTNVGSSDPIPPQQTHTISTGASLAWDRSGGTNNGRVYVVYTDTATLGSPATKIFVRYSDNNGKTWSAPVTVSDDTGSSSEFLPSIAVDENATDPTAGDVGVSWYDARNDPNDATTQFFAATSINGGQSFSPNVSVGLGSSDATNSNLNDYGQQNQYGDYTDLAFAGGILYPVWADNSTQLSGNPDPPQFELAEARPAVAQVADLPLTAKPLDISAEVKDEGSEFTANLATFTDPDPNAQLSNYTVTIDWGDPDPNTGAADTTTGTITANGGGLFTVSGTHVYQAASAYTITITIKDIGGSSVSVTTPALIQDAPLQPGGNVTLTAYEGQPLQGIVGTFTDADPKGAPDDYSTTIDWGDGQQSSGLVTFAGSAALTYDSANSTLYTFGNNDLLANNPPYLMAISLQGMVTPVAPVDSTFYGGIAFDPNNGTLYALSNSASGVSTLMRFDFSAQTFSPVAELGSGFTGGLAFNSADGNLYALSGAGSAWQVDQISPANGSVTVLGALAPPGNQPPLDYTGLSFSGNGNLYAVGNDSDGNSTLYQITLGSSVTTAPLFSLGNDLTTPPSTQKGFSGGLAFVPTGTGSLLAGSLIGISGDGSGTAYLNTIDLDGTTASAFEVFVAGQGKSGSGDFSDGFDIIGTHTYTQATTAPLTITITDVEPSQVIGSVLRSTATDLGTVTVDPAPPQAQPAPPPFTAYQGYSTGSITLASFTVAGVPSTAPGAYSATIDWGDGSPLSIEPGVVSGTTILVSGIHTYSAQGTFSPTIVLTDSYGQSGTAKATVNAGADFTALPAPPATTVYQGVGTGLLSLASFSIPAGLPEAGSGSYAALINWGDGSPARAGTVQVSGLTVTVSGSYTYASAGTFSATVLVTDNTGGGSASVLDSFTVLANVTNQVHATSTGPIYNPSTKLFNGSVTFTNVGGTTLTGPFPIVFQGLSNGVTVADATGTAGNGAPYINDPLATLPPNQSSTVAVQFTDPTLTPITYNVQVFDPPPPDPVQLVSTIDPSLISASAVGGANNPSALSMSADGRYVAFIADATNLVANGTSSGVISSLEGVYVRDTQTATTTLVSINVNLAAPTISPDGRYVAFLSGQALFLRDLQAGITTQLCVTSEVPIFSGNSEFLIFQSSQTNLVANDTTPGQLFEYNLQTGTTTMISVDAAGNDGGNIADEFSPATTATVSADGRFIAFGDDATNLIANDTASGYQLFLRDMQQGTTTLITVHLDEHAPPQISADGSTLVFGSVGPGLVNGVSGDQVYAYDVQTQLDTLVSVDVPGIGGGSVFGDVYQATIASDGRYVAYAYPTSSPGQIYVRDLETNTTVLASTGLSGAGANKQGAGLPLISADGRYVVFVSNATNLVTNDAAGGPQLFERDLQLGTTTLITVNELGTNAGNALQAYNTFCMSQDGHYVIFNSASSDLVPHDFNAAQDDFERDIPAQSTVLISAADPALPDLTGISGLGNEDPSVSANGQYVLFESDSSELVTNVPNEGFGDGSIGGEQIYVRNLQSQATTLVSIDSAGTGDANGPCYYPVMSADGELVVFESSATNLVANATVTSFQWFVRNLQTGITSLLNAPLTGTSQGTGGPYEDAAISSNDRYVVFESDASNLVANDAAGGTQLFVRDLQNGTTTLVSVNSAGTNGGDNTISGGFSAGFDYLPEISADGQYIAFESYSDNLVAGLGNPPNQGTELNVFVRNTQTGATNLVSVNETGTASGLGLSELEDMTPDGRFVVFTSSAGNLAANAPGGGVFERDLQQGTTTLVSVGNAFGQSASSDGRFITYSYKGAIYIRDMQAATSSLVSVEDNGTANANGLSQYSVVSANGQMVLFQSTATNLVSTPIASGSTQLYVRDVRTGMTKLVSIAQDGTQSGDQSTFIQTWGNRFAQFSADGSAIVFTAAADNLTYDFNGNDNIYAYSTAAFTVPAGVVTVSADPIHAVEGASFTGVVASFTDTDGDPIGNYTVTINWGDGGTSAGTVSANPNGSFNVTGTRTFAEAGFYPIGITVSDSDGSTASASTTVVETNPAGDMTYPVEVNTSSLEGTTGSFVLQFNPGATPNAQSATVIVSNVIVTGGSLTSALTDKGGASGSLSGTAQLANSSVLNEIDQGMTFGSSVRFDVTISGAAVEQPGNGDFGSTVAVQLLGADGVTPQDTIDPSGAVITVDVNPDGSTRVTNFASSAQGGAPVAGTFNVADAPLSAIGTTLRASAGTPFTTVIATFTDANPGATLSDYLAPTINWGDGQTSAGKITLGNNGTFDVTGTHSYAAAGTFIAGATINDTDGGVTTATTTITVQYIPTVTASNDSTTFTGSLQGYPGSDVTVTGANGLNSSNGTLTYTYNGSATVPTTVGSYAVVVTFTPIDATDYAIATGTATWTIKTATPTVTASNDSTTFTGSPQAYPGSDVTVTGANGLNNSDGTLSYTYNGSATVPTTAGSYAVVVTFTPTDATDYASASGTASWTIKTATPTVTASNDSTTFTGSPQVYPGSDVTVTGINGVNITGSGTLSYTYNGSATVPTTAGSYAVAATFTPTTTPTNATITEFRGNADAPEFIAAGSDGALWYTSGNGVIYRTTTAGVTSSFGNPGNLSGGTAITAGADGNLWFIGGGSIIYRMTTAGVITAFTNGLLPVSELGGITAGADGDIWFTENSFNTNNGGIGRITPAGVITNFTSGITPGALLSGITTGPDGNLWFTETLPSGAGGIGKIDPQTGVVTEYASGITSIPGRITAGSDGNLWFIEGQYSPTIGEINRIGRITTSGVVTEFSTGIGANAVLVDITAGPDGNLWFTENTANTIGQITTAGVVTDFSTGLSPNSGLWGITAGPDGNLWFVAQGLGGVGRVSGIGGGTTDYSSATGTATWTIRAAKPTATWASPAAITYGTALSVTQLDATASVPGSFVYTPAAGTVLTAGTQTLSVTFTPTDTTDYTTETQSVQLTVEQATPTVTWSTPAAITYGTALSITQLDAAASVPGSFVYTPAAVTVLTAGTQTLSVTFTPTDTTDYTTATQSVQLTVEQATPTITWATPAAINYGTALSITQLDATASVPGSFVYTPVAGTVLTAGTQTLSVTFTPTDTTDYTTATQSVQLIVEQATPTVTWSTPAAITYGAPLSATQLDATASVPGSFVYTPAAGTVLTAGTQNLSVTFTPTDTTDYTTATQLVQLTIGQATPTVSASDTGGTYDANPFPASATAIGVDGAAVAGNFAFTYYTGSSASGTGTSTAPTNAGTYTVLAAFTSTNGNYANAQILPATFTIGQATPTIVATDAGGTYNGSPFPASATATGVGGVSIGGRFAFTYYVGSSVSGTGSSTAPSNGGTYTVIAAFGSTNSNYTNAQSAPVTFTITAAAPSAHLGLLLLDPSGSGALDLTGAGAITVNEGGAVVVDSKSSTAAIITGSGTVNASQIDVTGGTRVTGSGKFSSTVRHAAPLADPLHLSLPAAPSTTFAAVDDTSSARLTLSPGTYVGGIKIAGSGAVTLLPGVYYMEGGGFSLTGSASVTGTGVLLINAPVKSTDSISLTGSGSLNLSPSGSLSGPYASYDGVTILQDPASGNPINVTGSGLLNITGVLYAPKATLNIAGSSGLVVNPDAIYGRAEVIASDLRDTGNGSVTINVNSPTLTICTPVATSVPGQPVPLVIKVSDPSTLAQSAPFTFTISFGDGDTKTLTGPGSLIVNHVYTQTGTYVVTVTATDEFGNTSAPATQTVKVVPVAVETDPFNSSLTALFVGTSGSDTIKFAKSGKNGIAVTINGVSEGVYSTTGPIVVFEQGGNDAVSESGVTNSVDLIESLTTDNIESDPDNEAIQWAGLTAAAEILST